MTVYRHEPVLFKVVNDVVNICVIIAIVEFVNIIVTVTACIATVNDLHWAKSPQN